jgi:hypothetical protein
MNVDNGHVVADLTKVAAENRSLYDRVPASLAGDVGKVLSGREEAYANLRDATPLTKWAKQKRKERRKAKKAARKAARRG